MSLTPKTNIPSLFNEKKVGLTPRADYHFDSDKLNDKHMSIGKDSLTVPAKVVRRMNQTVNDPANKGVNS